MEIRIKALAAALAALPLAPTFAAPPGPAVFDAALGGQATEPVAVDGYVYVAHGATVSAWRRDQPGVPVFAGDTRLTPADGALTGLVRRGDYLYASYNGYDEVAAGVAVYSIADRAQPVLLGQYNDYTSAQTRVPTSIAIVGDKLLLLDSDNGIYTGDLTAPARPVFTHSYDGWGSFHYATVDGNRVVVSGRNFIGMTTLDVFDASNASSLVRLGGATLDGYNNFRVKVRAPYAFGFGLAVAVTDFTNPANVTPRGVVDSPVSYNGLVLGNHAWGVGGFDGIEVFDIANLDAPSHLGTTPIDTFSTDASTADGSTGWLATRDDRLLRIDGSNPAQPALAGTALLAGGAAAMDIAVKGDTALILGNAFGLQIADAATFAPLGRYVTSLAPSLQGRAFENLAIDGNRAYLASWGTGLVVADVTNPRAPVESGVLELPFASSVAAQGNYAYVGTTTNGGRFVVVDVTNPAAPTAVGEWAPAEGDGMLGVRVHGNYAYVTRRAQMGNAGGLQVVDVTDPANPTPVALFSCGSASDVDIDRNGTLAIVACYEGVHLVDIRDPGAPVGVGSYPSTSAASVALRGDRAYVSENFVVKELDISNPAAPTLVATLPTGDSPRRVRATADAKVHAIGLTAGTRTFSADRLFRDGHE